MGTKNINDPNENNIARIANDSHKNVPLEYTHAKNMINATAKKDAPWIYKDENASNGIISHSPL